MENKILRKYIKAVRGLFPFYETYEKQYMDNLEIHLQEYLADHPEAAYADIVEEFGLPSSVVSEYFSEIEEEYLFKHLEQKKYVRRVMLLTVIMIVIVNIYSFYCAYNNYLQARKQDIVYEITIIEEE